MSEGIREYFGELLGAIAWIIYFVYLYDKIIWYSIGLTLAIIVTIYHFIKGANRVLLITSWTLFWVTFMMQD